MMGSGTLSIDVRTLRVLLPMWMRTAGFVVDDERKVVEKVEHGIRLQRQMKVKS